MLRRFTWLGVVLAAASVLGGCEELYGDCPELECTGPHSYEVCNEGVIREAPCGEATCVDTSTRPICAVSTTAVAQCVTPVHALVPHADTVCFDGAKVQCLEGYPHAAMPCLASSCHDTAACGAVCLESSPVADHPACTEPGVRSLCVGNVAVTCGCGQAPIEQPCPIACATAPPDVDPGEGFCALDAAPDPRCPDFRGGGSERTNAFCEGSTRVQCYRDFAVERQACASCAISQYGDVICQD